MEIGLSGGISGNRIGSNVGKPIFLIRMAMRPDGYNYYEMLLVYVDEIIIISHLDDQLAKQIGEFYNIK